MIRKEELEKGLEERSDFLKIEYLERSLRESPSIDVKKFIFEKLAELYEKKKMFLEAGKNLSKIADISITFREKIDFFIREIELYIRASKYDLAREGMKKALGIASMAQRREIKEVIKQIYLRQLEVYEQEERRSHAVKIYEILLDLAEEYEKKEIIEKLLVLYDKLGEIKKARLLREKLKK